MTADEIPPVRPERASGRRVEDSGASVLLALWNTKRVWIAVAVAVGSSLGWVMNTAIVPRQQVAVVAQRVDSVVAFTAQHIRTEASRDSAQDARLLRVNAMIESWAVGECLTKPRAVTARMNLPCTRLLNER